MKPFTTGMIYVHYFALNRRATFQGSKNGFEDRIKSEVIHTGAQRLCKLDLASGRHGRACTFRYVIPPIGIKTCVSLLHVLALGSRVT